MTGGWLFAPAALSDDGRMAAITREGFLFEWDAADAPACQTEWPSFRHDPQGTGNYDRDGTAPGAPGTLALTKLDGNIYRLAIDLAGRRRRSAAPRRSTSPTSTARRRPRGSRSRAGAR